MRYGLPYQGSKNFIAQWVIDHLPPADVLIDAFAGGCAITHCAMLSHKFKRVIANDINDIPQLFVDAIRGKYRNETRWISREDFFALKDTDPYVRVCWSFSNNGEGYIYGEKIEQYKKAFHYAAMFQDYTLFEDMGIDIPQWLRDKAKKEGTAQGRRLIIRRWALTHTEELNRAIGIAGDDRHKGDLGGLKSAERLERLQDIEQISHLYSLERHESLECLQRLQCLACPESNVVVSQGDYTQIPLPTSETYTIYCDPPYYGTNCGAYSGFDHDHFYEWLRSLNVPVVVSEYSMPSDFVLIDECSNWIRSDNKGRHKGAERLFCHESTIDKLPKTTLF